TGRAVLGGRAGAPGLPAALPGRVHLPLPAAELEAATPGRDSRQLIAAGPARRWAGFGQLTASPAARATSRYAAARSANDECALSPLGFGTTQSSAPAMPSG